MFSAGNDDHEANHFKIVYQSQIDEKFVTENKLTMKKRNIRKWNKVNVTHFEIYIQCIHVHLAHLNLFAVLI